MRTQTGYRNVMRHAQTEMLKEAALITHREKSRPQNAIDKQGKFVRNVRK